MILDEIRGKFMRRGWSLYEKRGLETLEAIVQRGSSEQLQEGKEYLVLPEQTNPRDANTMEEEVEYLTKIKRHPSIRYRGKRVPLACFSLQPTGILILANPPQRIPYQVFYEHLETLHSIKGN